MRNPLAYLYCIFTLLYLLSFGLFSSVFIVYREIWYGFIFTGSVIFLIVLWKSSKNNSLSLPVRVLYLVCLYFGGVVLFSGIFHAISLYFELPFARVNVAQINADLWKQENIKFTMLYLFFPVLLLLQYQVMRRIRFISIIRYLSVCVIPSIGVIVYQGFVDNLFLNRWLPWTKRIGGLASDPNAYALTAFLLFPVLLAGSIIEKKPALRILMIIVAVLLIANMIFAANRTAVLGVMLLVLLIPLIISISMHTYRRSTRLGLLILTIVLILGAYFALDIVADNVGALGPVGKRLATTWNKYKHEGMISLFTGEEVRGNLWSVGCTLLWKSPLGGWGPGGFYREYPNEMYLRSGKVYLALDSVLNHYLMIADDFGLPGLGFNIALLFLPIILAIAALRKMREQQMRIITATILISNSLFVLMIILIPPAYFPDVLWVWTTQSALLLVLYEQNVTHDVNRIPVEKKLKLVHLSFIILLALMLIGAYETSFGEFGYSAKQETEWWPFKFDNNCYPVEFHWQGWGQWCKRHAILIIPIEDRQSGAMTVKFSAGNPDLLEKPLEVFYGGKNGPSARMIVNDYTLRSLTVPLNREYSYETRRPGKESADRSLVLSLDVSRTWLPQKFGYTGDTRELGIYVLYPK
ncbi:MAG: hypothetical protein A2Y62_10970 [Candidatus Fischerbacteria bacterium RBG_13_37_8]|uniref:O-antigen ligase-related domain-containing protein n=1 Tax=Candidatus Fischerbacteria bacterium RBG_13_37_8 TaxID=1817863 RepID=A0A1F5VUJ6_9BACT|nr:MAG: hypothetical protein A2Y62_10970 [Candidatus Fischerbacteria bacterium RBG_13_37_8]